MLSTLPWPIRTVLFAADVTSSRGGRDQVRHYAAAHPDRSVLVTCASPFAKETPNVLPVDDLPPPRRVDLVVTNAATLGDELARRGYAAVRLQLPGEDPRSVSCSIDDLVDDLLPVA